MRYLKVKWIHTAPSEPVEIYSEIDDEDWEVRKVEVYATGMMDRADAVQATGSTMLSEAPHPSLAEIASDPQFLPEEISRSAFEEVWAAAMNTGKRS